MLQTHDVGRSTDERDFILSVAADFQDWAIQNRDEVPNVLDTPRNSNEAIKRMAHSIDQLPASAAQALRRVEELSSRLYGREGA